MICLSFLLFLMQNFYYETVIKPSVNVYNYWFPFQTSSVCSDLSILHICTNFYPSIKYPSLGAVAFAYFSELQIRVLLIIQG